MKTAALMTIKAILKSGKRKPTKKTKTRTRPIMSANMVKA